eukprot:TRINITY_DN13161_c0_g1_i1.p1 TRINITY_DN13161_c0_g1~~TRINITY_DN13161_c0_g1_i1.p1  ORF type:complete len:380 (+),score=107.55 TRINITY_DN13161_c0_g1_i1:86-1225(+)
MNIFLLALCPRLCAELHCDKHCVKMILEYCALLFSVHHLLQPTDAWKSQVPAPGQLSAGSGSAASAVMRMTHKLHPAGRWVRMCEANYVWLAAVAGHLCKEYTQRYGRQHCREVTVDWLARNVPPFTEPVPPFVTPTAEVLAATPAVRPPGVPQQRAMKKRGQPAKGKGEGVRWIRGTAAVIDKVHESIAGVTDMPDADKRTADVLDRLAGPGEGRGVLVAADGYPEQCTPLPLCMPSECWLPSATESYREYYRRFKTGFAKWKAREKPPEWYTPKQPQTVRPVKKPASAAGDSGSDSDVFRAADALKKRKRQRTAKARREGSTDSDSIFGSSSGAAKAKPGGKAGRKRGGSQREAGAKKARTARPERSTPATRVSRGS